MSVLIKGMEMPKCCVECEWHEYYGGDYDWVHACRRTGTMPIENAETERANDCPLVEIPTPHGRLVDIKSVEDRKFTTVDNEYERWWNGALDSVVDNAPTVIETGGETE